MVDEILSMAALPVVALDQRSAPSGGMLVPLAAECHRQLAKGSVCQDHYRRLVSEPDGTYSQCPFGFTSAVGRVGGRRVAITGVVAFPRMGGKPEARVAKRFPKHRVDRNAIVRAFEALQAVASRVREVEEKTIKQQAMALHEIRKLNRQVKQTAERLCREESPGDLDSASPGLVRIFKAADLMSRQFDVIEILANESLVQLPLSGVSEPYRLFDKCVRIYRGDGNRIVLDAPAAFSPRIAACEKTLPIIPSVLIENALKYAMPNTEVKIRFSDDTPEVFTVSVSNLCVSEHPLSSDLFRKGVRGATEKDGSGNGLYVAQLVAGQHGTAIRLESRHVRDGVAEVTMRVSFQKVS